MAEEPGLRFLGEQIGAQSNQLNIVLGEIPALKRT
jgi:hypothetical protein